MAFLLNENGGMGMSCYLLTYRLPSTCRAKLFRMACEPSRCCSTECVDSASKVPRTVTPLAPAENSTRNHARRCVPLLDVVRSRPSSPDILACRRREQQP